MENTSGDVRPEFKLALERCER